MAVVHLIRKSTRKNLKLNPSETCCECAFFSDSTGVKYFQIESSGSASRKTESKQSQVLQFDMEQLSELSNFINDGMK